MLRIFNTLFANRPKKISKWSKGLHFSNNQLAAMRSLWHWSQTGEPAASDPINILANHELAELLKRCELSFKPAKLRFRNEEKLRAKLMQELQNKGMNEMQAQIATGMKFCYFGPANELLE